MTGNIIKQRNSIDFTVKERSFSKAFDLLTKVVADVHKKLTDINYIYLLKNRQKWYTIYQAKRNMRKIN